MILDWEGKWEKGSEGKGVITCQEHLPFIAFNISTPAALYLQGEITLKTFKKNSELDSMFYLWLWDYEEKNGLSDKKVFLL